MRETVLAMGTAVLCLAVLPAQQRITHAHALARLKAGNQRFQKGESQPRPLGEGVRRTLSHGQHPYAIIVTSSDSRVVPEHIFNAGLGELFVVRTAGNVCNQDTVASIEYAAERLGAELCVVLALEGCSAVQMAARGDDEHESPAIRKLAEHIAPAIRSARREGLEGRNMLAKAEVENAYNTALECLRRSRSLRTLRQGGHFRMVTARYRANGHVEWLPERLYGPDIDTSQPAHRQKLRGLAPHVALSMLHAGHRRFLSPVKAMGDISPKRRAQLAKSEQSIAVVVTCSDSRVAPEHIFDAGLGELYVVRVAGNVFSDAVQASIEHAVANTGASICVVLGHEKCGMVAAAIQDAHDNRLSPSMRRLVQKIAPAVEIARRRVRNRENLPAQAVRVHAQRLVTQLRSGSRFLRELEKEGRLSMLSAVYELDTGDIHWLKDEGASGDRALLAPATPAAPAVPAAPTVPTAPTAPTVLTVPTAPIGPPPPEVLPEAPALPTVEMRPKPKLLLTIMAASMVAAAGLLLILLWQRRNTSHVANQGHPDGYDPDEHP